MKGKAIIILCCALAYMVGWTAIPRMLEPVGRRCCAKTMCQREENHCPKENKGNGGCADCGVSCPMCYTMILPKADVEETTVVVFDRPYPDVHATCIYGFHPDAWKPPNEL